MENTPLKMNSRSSRSMLKLSKPAPRKVASDAVIRIPNGELNCAGDYSPNNNNDRIHSVDPVLDTDKSTVVKNNVNIFNKRAARGLKVEKPAPLKMNNKRSDENGNSTSRMETGLSPTTDTRFMSPVSASTTCNRSITQFSSSPGVECDDKTRLMSQMSQDSGVGDMLSLSRNNSMIDTSDLIGDQDELEWDNNEDPTSDKFSVSFTAKSIRQEPSSEDDKHAMLEKCLPPQYTVQEFSILPDNFAEIEAELAGLSGEFDKLDENENKLEIVPEEDRDIDVVTKPVLRNVKKGFVVVTRQPLSPFSTPEEIWAVEEGMKCNMYTARGRRMMFKNYMFCKQDEAKQQPEPKRSIIQYTASDLLEIGMNELSKQEPDWWAYLSTIYPDICLKQVANYFDTERYSTERSYIVEHHNVEEGRSRSNTLTKSKPYNGSQENKWQKRSTTTTTKVHSGGFGAPNRSLSQPASESYQGTNNVLDSWNPDTSNQFNRETVNLNDKCDIRVGKSGVIPLTSSTQVDTNTTYNPNSYHRSMSDPDARMSSDYNGNSGGFYPGYYNKTSARRPIDRHTHDLVLKPDLPEKCPW